MKIGSNVAGFHGADGSFAPQNTSQPLNLEFYHENEEWRLIEPVLMFSKVEERAGTERKNIVVELKLARRPFFSCVSIVIPVVTTYILSALTFLVPIESGERVSFAVTLFLAQILTLSTLVNIFPETSLNFPNIGLFVCQVSLHMALMCLQTIFGYFLQYFLIVFLFNHFM